MRFKRSLSCSFNWNKSLYATIVKQENFAFQNSSKLSCRVIEQSHANMLSWTISIATDCLSTWYSEEKLWRASLRSRENICSFLQALILVQRCLSLCSLFRPAFVFYTKWSVVSQNELLKLEGVFHFLCQFSNICKQCRNQVQFQSSQCFPSLPLRY